MGRISAQRDAGFRPAALARLAGAVPTKRTFDLIVVTGILLLPSFGLLRLAAKRWKRESTGVMGEVGEATELVIGK